jgi:hypothetical protein
VRFLVAQLVELGDDEIGLTVVHFGPSSGIGDTNRLDDTAVKV